MSLSILHWQMIVCLRDGKEAAGQLKAIYPDEAKNVEVDMITAKLGELALQHRGTGSLPVSSSSAQHPKPNAVVESPSDPPSSDDDVEPS